MQFVFGLEWYVLERQREALVLSEHQLLLIEMEAQQLPRRTLRQRMGALVIGFGRRLGGEPAVPEPDLVVSRS